MIKNRSRYAILGILNISASTGYDIKKYCDTVISGFWNENFGHIYPTLKTLKEEGLIRQISEGEDRRRIKYEITDDGKDEFMEWLKEETIMQPVRSEFMLKFVFSSLLPRNDVIEMLKTDKNIHETKLREYKILEKQVAGGLSEVTKERARFLKATVRRGILVAQASIEWCDETIKDFHNLI